MLTAPEIAQAQALAHHIVRTDIAAGFAMYFDPGGGESRMDVNVRGFGAEIAAARATGLPRNEALLNVGSYRREAKPHDIGTRTEVRNNRASDGKLYVYNADPDGRYALLVTGTLPVYRVRGWIRTEAAKRKRYWRTSLRYPAWAIPQRDLASLPLPGDA